MSVSCSHCGETWDRDPALVVPCPRCHARAGASCRRPSGHECALHIERDAAALASGLLAPCPKAPRDDRAALSVTPSQGRLFA